MQTLGRLFETLCIRDLRTYLSARAETSDASLFYYRDDYGLEVDAIIELMDGRWAAIEIKLSENKVQKGVVEGRGHFSVPLYLLSKLFIINQYLYVIY